MAKGRKARQSSLQSTFFHYLIKLYNLKDPPAGELANLSAFSLLQALFPEDYFLHPGGTSSASTANSFPPMEETGELSNYGRGLRQAPAVTAPKHEIAEPEEYPISATALGLVKRGVSPAAARKKWRSRRWPKRNLYKNSRFGKKRKRVGMLAKMGLLGGGTGQTTEEKLAQISNAITMWEAKLMKFAEKFSDAPSVLNENPTWLRLLKVRDTLRQMLAKAELQALDQTRM